MTQTIPDTQYAVQLIGPDELELNTAKPVPQPGPTQMLVKRFEAAEAILEARSQGPAD